MSFRSGARNLAVAQEQYVCGLIEIQNTRFLPPVGMTVHTVVNAIVLHPIFKILPDKGNAKHCIVVLIKGIQ